jgi:hypothetical protein
MSGQNPPDQIDDLIVLGRSHPEPISDGRHTVCLGGYSPTYGYIRLYPTRMGMSELERWNIVSVPVEYDGEDHREESYKIQGSKEDWDNLHTKVEQVGKLSKAQQIQLVDELATDCPSQLNEDRISLGLVKPETVHDIYLDDTDGDTVQIDLTGRKLMGKTDFDHKLYINYTCDNCQQKTPHDQHVIEWGVYEFWKRNDDPERVKDALGFNNDDHHYFFVGNLRNHPTAYIIISVLRFKEGDMLQAGVRPDEQKGLTDW